MIRNNLSWINLNAGSSGGSGGGGVSDYNDLANRPIISMTGTSQNPLKLWNLSTGLYLLNGYVYYDTTNLRECINLFISITAQIQNGKYVLSAFVPSWEGHYEYIKTDSTSTDYTDTQILKMLTENDVLTLTNEVEYTPTTDYHPSTKKYVDEAMQSVMEEFAKIGVNEQDIKTLIAENRRRDIAIQALLNETADKNVTIEEDTHTISLDYSMEDGMATVNSIEGSTLVNVSKTVDEVYITKSQDRVEQTKVANTIGEQNGKICPIIEGDTLVNVCDQKDPIAITKSYTVENSGNHIALQGEYDGKCRPVIQGNTLMNLCSETEYYGIYSGSSTVSNTTNQFRIATATVENFDDIWTYAFIPIKRSMFKPNTKYTIVFGELEGFNIVRFSTGDSSVVASARNAYVVNNMAVLTTTDTDDIYYDDSASSVNLYIWGLSSGFSGNVKVKDVQIFEGDLTQTPELIPTEYVEGLKSSFEDNLVPQNLTTNTSARIVGTGSTVTSIPIPLNKNIPAGTILTISFKYADDTTTYSTGFIRGYLGGSGNTSSFSLDNGKTYGRITVANESGEYIDNIRLGSFNLPAGEVIHITDLVVLEGDWTANPPTYEEVTNYTGKYKAEYKVTGKNKFDGELELGSFDFSSGSEVYANNIRRSKNFIKTKEGETLSLSSSNDKADIQYIFEYDKNKEFIKYTVVYGKITLSDNTKFIKFRSQANGTNGYILPTENPSIQLEEGSTATEYEPYKEYTKTFYLNSPLLEGDTIEDVNGVATHVHRCNKVVLDGSENWNNHVSSNDYISFYLSGEYINHYSDTVVICNRFRANAWGNGTLDPDDEFGASLDHETIWTHAASSMGIVISKSKLSRLDVNGFKQWLSENPTTVIHQLASPTYEPISTEPILCDSYTNGHLDFDTNVPIEKVTFKPKYFSGLKYLLPNTTYKIQFKSDNIGHLDYVYMDDLSVRNIEVKEGINTVVGTTGNTIKYLALDLHGIGFNASNIVVTEATDKEFDYFNGIQSTFEENLVTDENNPYYGKYRVIYRTKSSDGNASTVKSVYLNSPLLQGDKLVVVNGKLCHYHKMGKVVLDGSEDEGWIVDNQNGVNGDSSKATGFKIGVSDIKEKNSYWLEGNGIPIAKLLSNTLPYAFAWGKALRSINAGWGKYLFIKWDSIINPSEFRQWLSENPTTVVYELETPYYEEISSNPKDTVVDFYANGTLEVQSAVYPLSMEFTSFEEELTYLYTSTVYTVQFEANGNATANITLGGTTVTNQEITHGLNRIQVTTPSTLIDNKLIIDGCGNCKISNIVVTNSIKEFDYFEGMKSSFEDKQNEDGTYIVEIVVYNAPIRLNKDKE